MESPNNPFVKPPGRPAGLLLENTLGFLRHATYFLGILPDWGRSSRVPNRGWNPIHWVTVALILSMIVLKTVFELIQLVFAIMASGGVLQGFICNLTWFATFPVILWAQISFIANRHEIFKLLEDWSRLELEFSFKSSSKRMYMFVSVLYLMIVFGGMFSLGQDIFEHPDANYLISHYPIVRDTLTLPGTRIFHLIVMFDTLIMICATDLVPSFFYSHVSSTIQSLERELVELFRDGRKNNASSNFQEEFGRTVRSVWTRFEGLSLLVERANWLFGSIMFLSHGVCVFMISTLLYYCLSAVNGLVADTSNVPNAFVNMMGFVSRLIICVVLPAKLDFHNVRLRATLTRLLNRHWDRISQGDRDILIVFLSRLQNDRVAACPSSLYYITCNFLLNICGLVVSYEIILLQSK